MLFSSLLMMFATTGDIVHGYKDCHSYYRIVAAVNAFLQTTSLKPIFAYGLFPPYKLDESISN